jgi:hypothetical protein
VRRTVECLPLELVKVLHMCVTRIKKENIYFGNTSRICLSALSSTKISSNPKYSSKA